MNTISKFQQKTAATVASLKSNIGVVAPILVLAISYHLIPIASADVGSNNKGVFSPDSTPYGITYGEWTAKWWQWSFSMPESDNPLVDDTGKNCAKNQSGPVWFLAGTGGGSVSRECTVPAGKGILIPIINVECDSASDSSLDTEEELRACAKADQDQVIEKEIIVDGIKIEDLDKYRFQSPLFNLTFPENNIAGLMPQTSKAVSDGFWVLLEPLSPGRHDIHFKAVLGGPAAIGSTNFALDVKYVLTVSSQVNAIPEEKSDINRSIVLEGSSTSGKFKVRVE
jgi:hypothetical protein